MRNMHPDYHDSGPIVKTSDGTGERDTSDVAAADKANKDVTMIEDERYSDTRKVPRVRAANKDATFVEDEWYGHEPNVDRPRGRNIYSNTSNIGDEWENSEPEVPQSRDTNKDVNMIEIEDEWYNNRSNVAHSRDTKGKGRVIPVAEAGDILKNTDQTGPEVARHEPTTVPEPEPELKQRIPPIAEDEVHQQGGNMANMSIEPIGQTSQVRNKCLLVTYRGQLVPLTQFGSLSSFWLVLTP